MPHYPNKFARFWQELKRRKVFGVVGTYTATAYIIIEVVNNLVQSLNLPPWIGPIVVLLLVIGLPLAVIISWIFDFTPQGIKKTESLEEAEKRVIVPKPIKKRLRLSYVLNAALIIAVLILAWPRIFKSDSLKRLASSGEKVAIAVIPFQNMTNDTIWNYSEEAIQMNLITVLSYSGELRVRQKETIDQLISTNGFAEYSSISPRIAGSLSRKLDADIYISGNIQKAGTMMRVDAKLVGTKTMEVLRSFHVEQPVSDNNIIPISDSLGKKILDFLQISKLIKENPDIWRNFRSSTNSPDALRSMIYAARAMVKYNLPSAIKYFEKAIAADSNFIAPMGELAFAYRNSRMVNKALSIEGKLYGKRDQMSPVDQLRADLLHAMFFESIDVQIDLLKQLQENDDQGNYHRILAGNYIVMNQFDKAILEYEKSLEIWRRWGKAFLKGNPAYASLGEAYHRTGQYKKARRIYREAERVNDDHTSIYFSWIIRDQAALALTEGDADRADKYIEKLISVQKENSVSEAGIDAELHKMYRQAGDLDKAEEYLRKALTLEPENPQRLNSVAAFLIVYDRKVEEGLGLIDKALELSPGNGDYLDTKGMGLYKLGKYDEALELLEKARDLKKPLYSHEISSHIEEVKKAIAEQK